ncbi:MAG: hypothetical protein H7A47_02375 [Verrucomicrobiales bacterium]|nr:hypothetical protein [Verrucomicrobiales bacterium]
MKRTSLYLATAGAALALAQTTQAAEAFPNPAGGWTYLYTGDQLQTGEPAFDGTWTHDNGSDAFGEDEIGGVLDPVNNPDNNPGGANLLTEGNTQYLRIQDTGDPRDYDGATAAWDDPSNRKIYFGHYLSQDLQEADTLAILDNGVTLTFRARIPTAAKAGGPLDPLHRDGQNTAGDYPDNGVVPYPEGGDGYLTSDGAKGNFVIRQIGDGTAEHPGGAVALSLTVPTDTPGGNPNSGQAGFSGLTMNERNGSTPNGNVDFGEGSGENNFALDPTDWHEFWIAIRKTRDPVKADATHDVFVWRDGTLIATSHKVTAGDGSDLNAGSFIATGGSATPQNFAIDIDWYGYKQGFVLPEGGQVPPDVIVTPVGGTMFYQAGGGLEVDVEALMPGSTIPDGGFEVILNDVDITGQLTLTGSGADAFRTATYNGLTPNTQYSAVVRVTDSTGLVTEITSDFDTFSEAGLSIESEDYNFFSGFFIDDPLPGIDYVNVEGFADIDFVDLTTDTFNEYRIFDSVDMDSDTDVARQKFIDASFPDYQVTDVETGEWLNYTRTFPNTVFTPYLRAGAGADRELRLDLVTGDSGQENQATKPLGLFVAGQTRTVNTYRYVPLTDALGRPRFVNLSGETTIRLTATDVQNDVNHNFIFLADAGAAESTLPWVSAASPGANAAGVAMDAVVMVSLADGDNAVTVSSITMMFDGADVTASLTKQDTAGGADVTYNPGGMAEGTLHTVELSWSDTAGGSDSATWSFRVEGTPVSGAKIAWVSFHPADDTPSDTAAGVGLTEASDIGYTSRLRDAGYQVDRFVTSATPDAAVLNTYDLVVISRPVSSSHYQNAGATAWNGITAPMMVMSGYTLRNSRMGYTTGATIPDTAGDITLKVNAPNHPIFAGVPLDADNVMTDTYAGIVTFVDGDTVIVQRGISVNTDPVAGDGRVLAVVATEADPTFGGMVIGEWFAGATMGNSAGDTLAGHRLVFLSGSREADGFTGGDAAGMFDLSDAGTRLFLNAVEYMLQPAQMIAIARDGGNVIISWDPAEGALEQSTNLRDWTTVEGATSPATIAVGDGNVFYRVRN